MEKALLFNDKKYPPLLPRRLRITRAKKPSKTASHLAKERPTQEPVRTGVYRPKVSSESQSLAGRAGKLLGRAGAAQYRKRDDQSGDRHGKAPLGVKKSPEDIVFEGHRANGNQGRGTLKLGKSSKKKPAAVGKRSKRSAAFKAGSVKKRSSK